MFSQLGLSHTARASLARLGYTTPTPIQTDAIPLVLRGVDLRQALATYASSTPVRVAAVFGGVAMNGQVQVLGRGVDIVVATPDRLLDHLQRRTIDLSAIEVLTLDEAVRAPHDAQAQPSAQTQRAHRPPT